MTGRHTILVVDDEPDVVQSVKDLLRLDYRVLGVTRAQEGLALMAHEEVHVVMSDQRMPGMTGVEFLHRIRGDYPEAIRLLFTGYADIRAVIEAINQGSVYRYITKPWDPDELLGIIHEACERYDLIVERNRLLQELQRRNLELSQKNDELRQSDALKAAFIHVASHELRTPLTILLGRTWLAQREVGISERVRDQLACIEHAGQGLHRLVNQIIKMLAAGQFERPLALSPVDLEALLKDAVAEVRPFIELRDQTLVLELAPDLGAVQVEAGKIRDSVHSVLMNAIKFTPNRGTITLAARRTESGAAEIAVRDTGIGIPADRLGLIFEPFFTDFDSMHHSSGQFEFSKRGIGLGLTVAREFVEMHGGTVAVQSEVGRGTCFTITLPSPPLPGGGQVAQ